MAVKRATRPAAKRPHLVALGRLRDALLALPESGENGFEGLMGALLGAVTQASVRLAASGSQGGQDGRGQGPAGAISFEAKLYTGKITKTVVANKATDILASNDPPDLWVLAATSGVTTQIAAMLRGAFAHTETTLLVLDWPANDPLPPLALLCAMTPEAVLDFLSVQWPHAEALATIEQDLAVLVQQAGFAERSDALRTELTAPALGAPNAFKANQAAYAAWFSRRDQAMVRFGQPLAPAAEFALAPVDRPGRADLDRVFAEPAGSDLVVVTGDQGCGKSWSVAQSWLAQPEPPFLVFLTSTQALVAQQLDVPTFVARALVEHAGDVVSDQTLRRWARRLRKWEGSPAPCPRLVVVVDGLNERARADWAPWLSKLAVFVGSVGGRVIVTSRAVYFKRIEDRFTVRCQRIAIADFSDAELNAILESHDIKPGAIGQRVRPSLRNPRILGIALELLSTAQIRAAEELSIERLLFEHLRTHRGEPATGETPYQFSRLLGEHAREVRMRIERQVSEDRLIFDSYDFKDAPKYDLPRDLLPVVEERFFKALGDDETLYELTDDGLVYGLAIATIRELQAAQRNGRSVAERLADIVEPVAALDKVTEVLFAAALLASVDATIDQSVASALLARHAIQQNADEDSYPAYCGIVRNIPAAALDALFELDTTDRHAPHKDWLLAALRQARNDTHAWPVIAARVDRWLRLCTLNPAHGLISGDNDAEKRAKALEKSRTKIADSVVGLTSCERAILDDKLVRLDDLDSTALSEDAFLLLAGMPLASFAEALMCWSFARALNSGYHVPWRDFGFVVQHNHIDWFETRRALLDAGECFAREDASRTARWALVYLLRATGDAEDGDRAEALAESLIEDWQRFEGWRLVERYCPTDPCDPASERPDAIVETATRYGALAPHTLMVNRAVGQDEHFLRDAGPGVARFEPEPAVRLNRAVLRDLLRRPSSVASLALTWLDGALVLIEPEALTAMIARAGELSHPDGPKDDARTRDWVVSQYLLVAAFAHLDGDAQAEVLGDLPEHGPPLLQLDRVFRPAKSEAVDRLLERAIQSHEEHRLLMALAFVRSSGSPLSEAALSRIRQLTDHAKPSVRGLAMQVSAEHPDHAQLAAFAASGWNAAALDAHDDFYERWHGSSLILAAAERDLLSSAEAIARIAPERYSDAARQLGSAAAGAPLASLVRQATARVLEAELPFRPPSVSQTDNADADAVALFSLDDDDDELPFDQRMERLNESDDEYAARQRAGWERFRAFEVELTKSGAELIVRDIGFEAVRAIALREPAILLEIAREILALPAGHLQRVTNLASRIARALAEIDPQLAVALFHVCEGREGFVRITRTSAQIPLLTWEAWHSAASDTMRAYWRERLGRAESDDEIAMEVLAASHAGHQGFLEAEADAAIASRHPVATARALMILGYCDQDAGIAARIEPFRNRKGLVGRAANAAWSAYERNGWSRVWYERLSRTHDPIDFWRYSTLLCKIVDARLMLWTVVPERASLLERFGWSLEKLIRRRIEAWKKKRSDKLFGGDRPRRIYLEVDRENTFGRTA